MEFVELRIHGVSGTTAAELLQTGPIPVDDDRSDDDRDTDLTKPPTTRQSTWAYRWASFTSGDPRSALWILLLPYMLVNVAGWALPPRDSLLRHRIDVAGIRLVGIGVTAIFALVTAFGLIVVGGVESVGAALGEAAGAALGALVTLVVIGWIWTLTRKQEPQEGRTPPPPVLEDSGVPDDWPALRALHVATGGGAALWTLGATVGVAFPDDQTLIDPTVTAWLGGAILVLAAAVAAVSPFLDDLRWPAVGLLASAFVITVAAAIDTWLSTGEPAVVDVAAETGGPIATTVVVLAAVVLAVVATTVSKRHRCAAPTIATLITIAGASGAAVGASIILLTAAAVGTDHPPALDLIAEGFLLGVLLLSILVAGVFLRQRASVESGGDRHWRAVVRIVEDPRLLIAAIPTIIAVVSISVFVAIAFDDDTPLFAVSSWIAGLVLTALAAWIIGPRLRWLAALGASVAAIYLAPALLGWEFRQIAIVGTLVIPALLMGSRIVSAIGDVDERRALAVPWDVGSFFPSVFHPFAPRPYGSAAVHQLRSVIEEQLPADTPVVVVAHSQGSVIALHALLGSKANATFLTVGSPLGTLYETFFPAHFHDTLIRRLIDRVPVWSNLWRATDPVGGPIDPEVDCDELDDPRSRIHGGYWYRDEAAYHAALVRHLRELGVDESAFPPPPPGAR